MQIYYALLAAIIVERIFELVVSQRHARASLAEGGIEYGQGHFPVMVVLHVGLVLGCIIEPVVTHAPFIRPLAYPMIVIVIAANALRWWCVSTLGRQWSARVIVVPGRPLVHDGPYRWLAHPNYVAVVVEGVALPLAGSAWITALTFAALNAGLLTVRLRCEIRALATAAP